MAKLECFDEIIRGLPAGTSQAEVRAIIKELQDIRSRAFSSDQALGGVEFRRQAQEFLKERRIALGAARKEAAENILKTQRRLNFYAQDAFKGDPVEAMRSKMVGGTTRLSTGGNASVAAQQVALQRSFLNKLQLGLSNEGVLDVVKKGLLDREIMQELFEMKPGGQSGISKSPEALKAATVIKAVQRDMLNKLQAVGSSVRDLPGYIMKQTHNPETVLAAGFDKWVEDLSTSGWIDQDKTFKNMNNPETRQLFMKGVFDDITTGRYEKAFGDDLSQPLSRTGPGNLDNRVSQSRTLHFKDADSFYEYNQKYGTKNVLESVVSSVQQNAKNIPLISEFGTNPRAAFEADRMRVGALNQDNPDAISNLESNQSKLKHAYDEIEGLTKIPGRSLMAKSGQAARSLENLSKLGSVVFAKLSEIPSSAAMLRDVNGESLFANTGKVVSNFMSALAPSERQKWGGRLGILADDLLGHDYARFGAEDSGPGTFSKMQRLFGKLSGLEAQTNAGRAAIAKQFALELADHAGADHGSMPKFVQASLERYGITSKDWPLLQRSVETFEDGARAMTPEGVTKLPSELIENVMLKNGMIEGDMRFVDHRVREYRAQLEMKLATYLSDSMDTAIPQPGARERAFFLRGTSADDGLGQMLRLMQQFKGVPMKILNTTERLLMSNPETKPTSLREAILGGKGDIMGMAQFMAYATVMGYIGNTARELTQGKAPKSPTDPKTIAEAMIRGGSGGIYGDFLLGEYDKTLGRSALGFIAGPTLGQVDDVATLYAKIREGNAKATEGFNLLLNNTPGQNLPYLRAAMNHVFLYKLQEYLSPGSLRRSEQKLRKNPGLFNDKQDYLFSRPSEVAR